MYSYNYTFKDFYSVCIIVLNEREKKKNIKYRMAYFSSILFMCSCLLLLFAFIRINCRKSQWNEGMARNKQQKQNIKTGNRRTDRIENRNGIGIVCHYCMVSLANIFFFFRYFLRHISRHYLSIYLGAVEIRTSSSVDSIT